MNPKASNDNTTNDPFEKELKVAFDYFDEDGSGAISKEELEKVMKKLGLSPTQVELQEMLDEIDNDKTGEVNFSAFKKLMTKSINDDFIFTSCLEAFSIFDKSKSGKLERREIVKILQKSCFMELDDVNTLLENIQFDSNHEIDYNEFVRETFKMLKN